MNYFSRITADHWTAKNNSQDEAKELAMTMDKLLISGNNLKEYLNDFKESVKEINESNTSH